MKRYLLLRDNQESGPFTLEEITARPLKAMDLIWVEEESNSWKYALEMEELSPFVQPEKETMPRPSRKRAHNSVIVQQLPNIFVALPPQLQEKQPQPALGTTTAEKEEPVLETKYEKPLDEIKEMYVAHLKAKRFQFPKIIRQQNGLWIAALFMGLLVSAVIIKKIVDTFEEQANSQPTASAVLPAQMQPLAPSPEEDAGYQNALTTEVVPVDTTLSKAVKKTTAKKVNINKLVRVSANDYKVGVFGGIDKLKLNVNNKSDHVLDKVTIEVKFLKPNGETVRTENYFMKAVAPRSIKTMEIPPSKRGVKIQYRITNIKSHPYKAAMVEV